MLRTVAVLCLAACLGVMIATSLTCAIGLSRQTSTWCGPGIILPIGIMLAIPNAIILGIPAALAFEKAGLNRWWQFVIGGIVISLPAWYVLAEPFSSTRWQAVGFFDSLNYLGTGAIAGGVFWFLKRGELRKVDKGPDSI